MGQRLVIELIEHDDVVASIYFHWSAYFSPAIQELKYISDDILEAGNSKDVMLAILEGLEKRGGGLRCTPEDMIEAKKLFPDRKFKNPEKINRNDGIITFISNGITDFYNHADGFASINLDTKQIINRVWEEPEPFEFTTTEEDGIMKPQFVMYKKMVCPVKPSDMTCESVQRLYEFMEKRFEEE